MQTPDAGPFNVLDLDWMFVAERKSHFKVAAFAKGRLSNCLDGEAEKGCTFKISGRKADKRTPWVITDLTALCKYLFFTTLEHQEKANFPLMTVQRHHRKIIMGQSVKNGCGYHFAIKECSNIPDVLFIKHPCKVHAEHHQQCRSMQNVDVKVLQYMATLVLSHDGYSCNAMFRGLQWPRQPGCGSYWNFHGAPWHGLCTAVSLRDTQATWLVVPSALLAVSVTKLLLQNADRLLPGKRAVAALQKSMVAHVYTFESNQSVCCTFTCS